MFYIKAASVRKKAKSQNKRVSKSFLVAIDLFVDKKIEQAIKNAGSFKTLTRDDLL